MTDEGMAITIAGVDYIETKQIGSPSEAELRSLTAPRYMIEVGDPSRDGSSDVQGSGEPER